LLPRLLFPKISGATIGASSAPTASLAADAPLPATVEQYFQALMIVVREGFGSLVALRHKKASASEK